MTSAANLYHSVINDVVNNVRDSFLDEAVDESVLQELKQLWTSKLDASKTIEQNTTATGTTDSKAKVKGAAAAAASSGGAGPSAAQGPPGLGPQPAAAGAAAAAGGAAAGGAANQLVITDPNRLVPVQITIPAQPGNPASQARGLTVQVPAHALQQSGPTSQLLQQVIQS